MGFVYLLFHACLKLQFPDVETPGPRLPVHDICRILCCNVWVLYRNPSDLTLVLPQYDLYCATLRPYSLGQSSHVGVIGSWI